MGFELATYAMGAGSRDAKWSSGMLVEKENYTNKFIANALRPLIEQLPIGASLVTEYEFTPKIDGSISLRCGLHIEAPDDLSDRLNEELAICLATLSDHFGFRSADAHIAGTELESMEKWVVRPLAVSCLPHSSGMGFASAEETNQAIRLPVPQSWLASEQSPGFRNGTGNLSQFIKAARALRRKLSIRISLVRDRLPEMTDMALVRLLRETPEPFNDAGKDIPKVGQTMIIRLLQDWSERSADILRVKVEAEGPAGQAPVGSLLRILAAEMFPGLRVEVVPCTASLDDRIATVDLSNAIPLDGHLPPLLPPTATLEAWDFPRHFDNPSVSLPGEGILLGHAQMAGFEHPVRITEADRSRHVYLLGATGTGKSTLLSNMIRQDMEAGRGIAMIDPHGDLFEQVLAAVPPKRVNDVIIIDPSDEAHLVGLNPFDFEGKPDLLKVNRVINDLLDIFGDLWNMWEAGGPGFEQYFRNIFLLASTAQEHRPPDGLPVGAPTLLTAIEIMRQSNYRSFLLKRCSSSYLGQDIGQEVVRFFNSAHATEGEHRFENWVPYVTSKLTRFTNNPQIRKMLCTPKRTIDFRHAIDQGKIVLVNLNKGRLGNQNISMIGMLITKYLLQAALSRGDMPREARRPFYYYIDEFQNFVTRDIPAMLAEARKYGLHLTLAHQTLGQLKDQGSSSTLNAVLGNVATRLIFRAGLEEARTLEPDFLPHFDARAMAGLPDGHVMSRLLVRNKPSTPFVFETLPNKQLGETDIPARVRDHSRQAYSVPEAAGKPDLNGGTGNKSGSVLLLHGVLAVGHDAEQATQVNKLNDRLEQALLHWHKPNELSPGGAIKPEKGKFYRTANKSVVLIYAVTDDGSGFAMVIIGGHGESGIAGKGPGEVYLVGANGEYSGEYPGPALLGMDLLEEADLALNDPEALKSPINKRCDWLFDNRPLVIAGELEGLSKGFYRTLNNSLVYVREDSNTSKLLHASICHGGHGHKNLFGARAGEPYLLTAEGHYFAVSGKLDELTPSVVALISGMSLAEYLPLSGNIPVELRAAQDSNRAEVCACQQ
jgi:hypothetical protein